jgi:serine/threonine-protein kinase RsbW
MSTSHDATALQETGQAEFLVRLAPREHLLGLARRYVTHVLGLLDFAGSEGDAVLVASELAGNAVRHAHSPILLSVRQVDDGLEIAVLDDDEDHHDFRPAEPGGLDESGRGLQIVAACSREWGVRPEPGGKEVWAILADSAAPIRQAGHR